MEAFEQFVAVAMQAETPGLVVSSAVKFPIKRRTKKAEYAEYQTHGYEVDLVGANAHKLILATVKSYFGSHGVSATEVAGGGPRPGQYRLLNDPVIRQGVIDSAAERFGYDPSDIYMRLYVGKFNGRSEPGVREWCASQVLASGPIEVYSVKQVVALAKVAAAMPGYRDDPSLVALKVLQAAGEIELPKGVT